MPLMEQEKPRDKQQKPLERVAFVVLHNALQFSLLKKRIKESEDVLSVVLF